MKPIQINSGASFGRWTVIRETQKRPGRHFLCRCSCEAGTEREVHLGHLRYGKSSSCGCISAELPNPTTHGESGSAEYKTWCSMIARCENPKNKRFPDYGGRGIRICKQWRESFGDFLADMGRKPSPQHSIDRIDVNGNYEPGNCRWATAIEQRANRRDTRPCVIL